MNALEKVKLVADAMRDRLAEDIVALDVRNVASFADAFVIASGRSDRQVRAIVDAVEKALAEHGEKPLGVEGYAEGRWVLMDLNDVIVHVLHPEARLHYDLERLWSDAERIPLEGDAPRRTAP